MATKIGQLAQELARLNPWWRDAHWAAQDPDLRDADRTELNYTPPVLQDLVPGCLYILRGPRRVGKTVAIKQKISELLGSGVPATSIVRVATDGWAAKDLRTLAQNVALPKVPDGTRRIWFLDEVSAITGDWAQQLKWLRDNEATFREATVVLTGSDAASLTAAAGTLAGRRGDAPGLDRVLMPIGFRTFAALVAPDALPDVASLNLTDLQSATGRSAYEDLLPWLDALVDLWERYITYGGFPRSVAAAAAGQPVPRGFVEDIFNVIAGDAFASSKLSSNAEMALLERLWVSLASPANLTSIGTDLSLTRDVVGRHVEYLRDAFLLWHCPRRHDTRWVALEAAQDKLYAVDPLVARLSHLRNADRDDIDPTVLTEMQLGMAIRRRAFVDTDGAPNDEFLFYYRTKTRKEIDFVSRHMAGVAIEGKYCEDGSWRREAAPVNASEWGGLLCTRNVLDTSHDDSWAVPAGVLAYVLDT